MKIDENSKDTEKLRGKSENLSTSSSLLRQSHNLNLLFSFVSKFDMSIIYNIVQLYFMIGMFEIQANFKKILLDQEEIF